MTPGQIAIVETILRLAESLKSELPPEERGGLDVLLAAGKTGPGARLADKGWFTLQEAAVWTGRGRKFLNAMIRERKLWYQRFPGRGRGGGGEIRIPRAHLDDQMARSFPVLDMPMSILDADSLTHNRPVTRLIPLPKTDDDDLPPPRVK
jgi:hypothetical protein